MARYCAVQPARLEHDGQRRHARLAVQVGPRGVEQARAVYRFAVAAARQPRRSASTQGDLDREDNIAIGPAPSSYGPPPGNRRPDPFVIGPSDAAYPFCAGWFAVTPEPERAGFRRLPQHVGIFGFSQTSKCCRTTSGLPQLDHKLMRREPQADTSEKRPTSQGEAGPSTRGSQATLGSHPCVALSSA